MANEAHHAAPRHFPNQWAAATRRSIWQTMVLGRMLVEGTAANCTIGSGNGKSCGPVPFTRRDAGSAKRSFPICGLMPGPTTRRDHDADRMMYGSWRTPCSGAVEVLRLPRWPRNERNRFAAIAARRGDTVAVASEVETRDRRAAVSIHALLYALGLSTRRMRTTCSSCLIGRDPRGCGLVILSGGVDLVARRATAAVLLYPGCRVSIDLGRSNALLVHRNLGWVLVMRRVGRQRA